MAASEQPDRTDPTRPRPDGAGTPSAEAALELSLARSAVDRTALLRRDPEVIARALGSSATRVLDLYGDRAPYRLDEQSGAATLVYRAPRPEDADAFVLLLGRGEDGADRVAVVHRPEPDQGHRRANLRRLGVVLGDHDVGLLVSAVAMANWHAGQGFCPRCGSPTESAEGGWVRICVSCGKHQFPRTDPAVIMSVTDADDRLLLARGPQWPPGRMSVLAGFVEPGESLEAAVAREVREEVGLEVDEITYRGNQPWPFPASLMLGFSSRARTDGIHRDDAEIAEAQWFSRSELAEQVQAGTLALPGRLSIARSLIEHWYGSRIEEPHQHHDPRED